MAEEAIVDAEVVEEVQNLPAVRASEAIVAREEITVEELVAQRQKIVDVMEAAMREGVHYGLIPGINKPTLFKPGAEVLNVLLRLSPSYESERTFHDGGHLTVVSRCRLTHIPTSLVIAEGEGLCSTYETKYAYRTGGRVCPVCGEMAIIKGKEEYGGGWICFKRKGGCGAKWSDGTDQAKEFENTETGRADNPDLADSWNTVLKMADKRALIAAILNGTAASDVFTQDAEDLPGAPTPEPPPPKPFDPETDLMPGAIQGKDTPKLIAAALDRIDPTVDWQDAIFQALGQDWRGLTPAEQQDFWRRLSNAVRWITNEEGEGDFPPAGASVIEEGFAFAFSGAKIELTYKPIEDVLDEGVKDGGQTAITYERDDE